MHLDGWTSLVFLPLVLFVISAGYLLSWVQDRTQAVLLWMAGGTGLPAIGCVLLLCLPEAPATVFGNAVTIAGLSAQWMACRIIAGRKPWLWAMAAAVCIWLAETRLPGVIHDFHFRLIAFSLLSSSLFALAFLELRRTQGGACVPNFFVSGFLLVLCAGQLGWAAFNVPLWSHYPGSGALTTSPGFSYIMLATVAAATLLNLGIMALVRGSAEQQYRQAALVDVLTGLGNRRRLDEYLEDALRRARGTGSRVAVIMIDVDCFKMYNDCYGHVAGDACLRAIAEALRAGILRRDDQVMRYGGEEFAVVLPNTGESAALQIAQALRLAVRRLAVPQTGREGGAVTISAGVAVSENHATAQSLLQAADEALYLAKKGGRDQVARARAALAFG